MEIILASSSPRRQQLLGKIVNDFSVIPSNFDENKIKEIENDPEKLVKKLAESKAFDVFNKLYKKDDKEFTVIGADTVVFYNNKILGKPSDRNDAIRMLKLLENNPNDVYTGTSVIMKKENSIIIETFMVKSTVYFKHMEYYDILNYVNSGEPLDKAGAYAIQGMGKNYLKGYDGDYDSIIGLSTNNIKNIFDKYDILGKRSLTNECEILE